jgi:branched-subunit amino acid transport protein
MPKTWSKGTALPIWLHEMLCFFCGYLLLCLVFHYVVAHHLGRRHSYVCPRACSVVRTAAAAAAGSAALLRMHSVLLYVLLHLHVACYPVAAAL